MERLVDWLTEPVAISLLALAFTVLTFWWVNARPGRVMVSPPTSFASAVMKTKGYPPRSSLHLGLPLVMWNPGAIPVVVRDLKLTVVDVPEPEFVWNGSAVSPGFGQTDYARPFAIPARGSVEWTFTFDRPHVSPMHLDQIASYEMHLKALLVNERRYGWKRGGAEWREVLVAPLHDVRWGETVLLARNETRVPGVNA